MPLPELLANSPTPGLRAPLTMLAENGGGITAGATTMNVAAPAPAPLQAAGQFRVVIDSEILIVTAGANGTTWTVARGAEGTTPASHADTAQVYHYITAQALENYIFNRAADSLQPGVMEKSDFALASAAVNTATGAISAAVADGAAWVRDSTGAMIRVKYTSPNLVANPLTTLADTQGWAANSPSYWLSAGSTLTSVSTPTPQVGPNCMRIATNGSATYEGAAYALNGPFLKGVTYTFSIYLRGNAGGEALSVALGAAGTDAAAVGVSLTTGWQRFSISWTPTQDEAVAYAVIRVPAATAVTFFANAAQGTRSTAAVPYAEPSITSIPTPGVPSATNAQRSYILQMDTSGRLSWGADYAETSGLTSNTMTNLGGGARVPDAGCLGLHAISLDRSAGPLYNFGNGSPVLSAGGGGNWIDRRPAARGAFAVTSYNNGGNIQSSVSGAFASQLNTRIECSGVPLNVRLSGVAVVTPAGQWVDINLTMDGSQVAGARGEVIASAAGLNDSGMSLLDVTLTPTPGSHLFGLALQVQSTAPTFILETNSTYTPEFVFEEKLRASFSNGSS